MKMNRFYTLSALILMNSFSLAAYTEKEIQEIIKNNSSGSDLEITVPSWLVLENPEILDYDTGTCYEPYGIIVTSESSIANLSSHKSFNKALYSLFVGHWDGGTFYKTFFSLEKKKEAFLSFAPQKFDLKDDEKPDGSFSLKSDSLERWSFLGPWNRKKYDELKVAFEKFARELEGYYASHDLLKKYAPYATNYLNASVHWTYPASITVASEKAFHVFGRPSQSLEELKSQTKDFLQEDWNVSLSYAILNSYGVEILDWLVKSGADINAIVDGESSLIKAADRPDVLEFLLDNGASIESCTDFGKTALFYAVQFNNLASVKVLIDRGADVNATLRKSKEFGVDNLEKVIGLTPLAYSICYGSDEMTKYLTSKGASLENISKKSLQEWIENCGNLIYR